MKNFITNSGVENLKKRLEELIGKSQELKFLVGFFYFSGIWELYSSLKKTPGVLLKVLVGLNVDKLNQQLIEYADSDDENGHLSNEAIGGKFLDSVKKSINTEKFDTKEFYEQVRFFVNLIKNDRLIIRKTLHPNHAKLYIFKLSSDQVGRQTLFITGSSNLTSSGLTTQQEFNVEIGDYGFQDAEAYFDTLWDESVKITEDHARKKRLIEIIEKETLIKDISPFEAFVLVLKIYLESFEKKKIRQSLIQVFHDNGYTPYKYQLDAIRQALGVIEKNNGVILADVVGLGKTIIACAIAYELGMRGVIICPPGLMGDQRINDSGWNMYKEQFKLHDWTVWSLGDLEKLQNNKKLLAEIGVVIVDEVHRFRNQDTQSYECLKNICRGKKVILLTATPFNNRPDDILSILKLFVIPKKSAITLEDNLVDKFRSFQSTFNKLAEIKKYYNSPDQQKRERAFNRYESLFGEKFASSLSLNKVTQLSKSLSKQIRDVIEPVTIRRNRLDLELHHDYKQEVKNLSEVANPQEWFYELTTEQSDFYDTIIGQYFVEPSAGGRFKGAIYRPIEYESAANTRGSQQNFVLTQQLNLYDFMRRLLVKRFESSFGSFEASVKNFKRINELVLMFIKKTGKYILDRGLLERIYYKTINEIEMDLKEYSQKITDGVYPKNHKIYLISTFKCKKKFLYDIQSDIDLFDDIIKKIENLKLVYKDPKTACLIKKIKEHLKEEPMRKIVIFSEYVDTVKYLEPYLKKHFNDRVLVIEGDLSASKLTALYENFDASYRKQGNDYDILLASDKLSEGFNLNRAGMVINYDIPWNPVRVIQRLGRINRISKKVFDKLYIVNFFPTVQGAELIKSREIAANKMFLIHNTLGEDAKIFDITEEPTPAKLYKRIQQNPDKLEEESFYTKVLNKFMEIKRNYPDLVSSIDKFPPRVKVSKKSDKNELFVFIRKGRLYIYRTEYRDGSEISNVSIEEVLDDICCSPEEKPLKLSSNFWDFYEKIKNYRQRYLPGSTGDKSLEQRAVNNLKTLLRLSDEKIFEIKKFVETLLEDIFNYGTLPDYTLRRISNLEVGDEKKLEMSIKEIESLKTDLGEDYLEKEKQSDFTLSKEIIVAIENQKNRGRPRLTLRV